ncbi:unnamed protein product, partial [Rotaria socialis]
NQTVPFKQLFGFERIHLAINETKEVFFPFTIEAALAVTRDGSKWLYSGLYRIFVGQQQHMFSIELRGQSARLA